MSGIETLAGLVYPKTLKDNLELRVKMLDKAKNDAQMIAGLLELCKKDILFFFNMFLFTHDTRNQIGADLPFITYDYEDKMILDVQKHIQESRDFLIEKSRDMGATWCILGVIYHKWLFEKGFLAHLGSKSEDDVDRSGDMKSLFEKLRYLIRKTPSWMLPPNFAIEKDVMFMRIINSYNNNSITGESANQNFSRAGRYKVVMLDEFAAVEWQEDIWRATADSSPCRIVASTPRGTGNKFWDLRFNTKIDVMTLNWFLHPEKSIGLYEKDGKKRSLWYDAEAQRRSAVDLAQEVDIDYITSGNPYFNIMKLREQKVKEPQIGIVVELDRKSEFRETPNGMLRLFEKPVIGEEYVIGADASEGLSEGDYSAMSVRKKKTRDLVCGYKGKLKPEEFAGIIFKASKYYNNALIACENGGYGYAVNQELYAMGARLYRKIITDEGTKKQSQKLGFTTQKEIRNEILMQFEEEIRNVSVNFNDKLLITECMNFVSIDGKAQAAEGSHDDYIMATAIAGHMVKLYPIKGRFKIPKQKVYLGLTGY